MKQRNTRASEYASWRCSSLTTNQQLGAPHHIKCRPHLRGRQLTPQLLCLLFRRRQLALQLCGLPLRCVALRQRLVVKRVQLGAGLGHHGVRGALKLRTGREMTVRNDGMLGVRVQWLRRCREPCLAAPASCVQWLTGEQRVQNREQPIPLGIDGLQLTTAAQIRNTHDCAACSHGANAKSGVPYLRVLLPQLCVLRRHVARQRLHLGQTQAQLLLRRPQKSKRAEYFGLVRDVGVELLEVRRG